MRRMGRTWYEWYDHRLMNKPAWVFWTIYQFAATIALIAIMTWPVWAEIGSSEVVWTDFSPETPTEMAEYITGYTDVAVGVGVTGLTTSVGSNTYSSAANKVTYNKSCIGMKGSNAAGVTWLKTFLGSAAVNPVVGTSHACSITSSPRYALMHLDNDTFAGGTLGMGLFWEESSSAQPTDWASTTDTLTFMP